MIVKNRWVLFEEYTDASTTVNDVKIDDVFAFAKEIYLGKNCKVKFRKKFKYVISEDLRFRKYKLEED